MKIQYRLLKPYKDHVPCPAMPESSQWEQLQTCAVCGSGDLQLSAALEGSLQTVICGSCNHSFHARRPALDWHEHWYAKSWDNQPGAAKKSIKDQLKESQLAEMTRVARVTASRVAGRLTFNPDTASETDRCFAMCYKALKGLEAPQILSIGCGNGSELLPFYYSGLTVRGIEASERRVYLANRLLGGGIENLMVEDLSPDTFGMQFDLVFSNHVLEHCLDVHEFMRAALRVLKPGGFLQIAVPDRMTMPVVMDLFYALHPHRFSPGSLRHLLEQHGFRVVKEDHRAPELRILAKLDPDASGVEEETTHASTPEQAEARFLQTCRERLAEGKATGHLLVGFEGVRFGSAENVQGNEGVMEVVLKEDDSDVLSFVDQESPGEVRYWVK